MAKTVAEMIGEAKARIEAVSPKDAADERAAGKAVFLDVREPVEWEHHSRAPSRSPGDCSSSPPTPRAQAQARAGPGRSRDRVLPLRVRAALACATLKDMGFENVANLEGGFGAWQEAGLPVSEHHDGL